MPTTPWPDVDIKTHLVVAQPVTDHTNDKQEVAPTLARLDALPEAIVAVAAQLADTAAPCTRSSGSSVGAAASVSSTAVAGGPDATSASAYI